MARYTTLKDVAELAGTTTGTVSYVLNGKQDRYISDDIRQRVLKAAKELKYIKCNGASSLKGKANKLVGILIPQFENQFFTRIVMAAEDIFVKQGFDMIICDTYDDPDREKEIIRRLIAQRVDGVIVTPTKRGVENTEILREIGMKMVVVDRPLDGVDDYYWVTTNNYGCGQKGMQYLLSKGHKNIGYVGWNSGIADLDARKEAIFDEARDKAAVYVVEGGISATQGYELTKNLLTEHPDISAVFFGFNIQAKGGVDAIIEMGFRIPEDISVLLIGTPEWSYTGMNNFTCVAMNDVELGRTAAKVLLDQIQDIPLEPQKFIHDCYLKEGRSILDKEE